MSDAGARVGHPSLLSAGRRLLAFVGAMVVAAAALSLSVFAYRAGVALIAAWLLQLVVLYALLAVCWMAIRNSTATRAMAIDFGCAMGVWWLYGSAISVFGPSVYARWLDATGSIGLLFGGGFGLIFGSVYGARFSRLREMGPISALDAAFLGLLITVWLALIQVAGKIAYGPQYMPVPPSGRPTALLVTLALAGGALSGVAVPALTQRAVAELSR